MLVGHVLLFKPAAVWLVDQGREEAVKEEGQGDRRFPGRCTSQRGGAVGVTEEAAVGGLPQAAPERRASSSVTSAVGT